MQQWRAVSPTWGVWRVRTWLTLISQSPPLTSLQWTHPPPESPTLLQGTLLQLLHGGSDSSVLCIMLNALSAPLKCLIIFCVISVCFGKVKVRTKVNPVVQQWWYSIRTIMSLYLAPSVALGAAQQEWLDLRIHHSARRWRLPGLQCLSKSEPWTQTLQRSDTHTHKHLRISRFLLSF